MIGKTRLLADLSRLVKRARVDAVSICAHARSRRVFRFAYEAIHQDLTQETIDVTVKVMKRRRVGVASANTFEPTGLLRCLRAAEAIAAHSPEQQELPLPVRPNRFATTADRIASTAASTPLACVTALKRLFQICAGAGAALAGSLATGEDELAVVNSSDAACYAASTVSGAKLVTMYRKLSGYASGVHRDVDKLDLDGLLKRSLRQSLHREDPVTLPLGAYEVILEPEAVAELLTWLGYTAFGAKSVQEHTSFLTGRMGERVFGPQITIYDDGREPSTLRMPFDFEGTPKQRVVLIDRGNASGIVYDTLYGARFGHPSTGHAMPAGEVDGPLPLHLGMAPGTTSLDEMIRSCKRGLLIPRFHYVNGLLNPREALMTGLTREGAFLIERGKLARPVRTLRFTQSLLPAFRSVLGVSKERRLIAEPSQELGCALAPTLHLGAWTFTGRSED